MTVEEIEEAKKNWLNDKMKELKAEIDNVYCSSFKYSYSAEDRVDTLVNLLKAYKAYAEEFKQIICSDDEEEDL